MSGSRSDITGRSGSVSVMRPGAPVRSKIIDHDARHGPQVRRSIEPEPPAFRSGELHEALGQAGEPLERRLDVGGSRLRPGVVRLRLQALGLRDGPGERGPKLVRGIGRKAALCVEGRLQPSQNAVQRSPPGG